MEFSSEEKGNFIRAIRFPIILIIFLWVSKGLEIVLGVSFGNWGIYPKSIEGIPGILFSPLIHADFEHLFSNSVPLLILTTSIFYFYKPLAFKIVALIWVVSGICVWLGGRSAYHIGASGLVYGEASFLFFSGVLRRNVKLAAISLLVIFLYGGMVWGIFPIIPEISWESHLFGGLSGLVFALIYKDEGPQQTSQRIEDDEDDDDIGNNYWNETDEEETENFPVTKE